MLRLPGRGNAAPASSSPPSAGPSPAPAPSPTAIAYGPVSVVEGTNLYTDGNIGDPQPGANGRASYPNAILNGLETPNDTRVAGSFVATPWQIDVWGQTADMFGSGILSGFVRIVNAGGSWGCRVSGLSDNRGNTLVTWCAGADSYKGLGYFELLRSGNPFTENLVQGEVFPGAPPTP